MAETTPPRKPNALPTRVCTLGERKFRHRRLHRAGFDLRALYPLGSGHAAVSPEDALRRAAASVGGGVPPWI